MTQTVWGQRLVAIGVAVAIAVTPVVILIVAVGQPIQVLDRSLGALAAWSNYVAALATLLLVILGIAAGLEARREFRTGHRPVPSVGGAYFRDVGIEILIENVGPGAALRVDLSVWAVPLDGLTLTPIGLADAIDILASQVASGLPPLFVSEFTALGPGRPRSELLSLGPRAGDYDPDWAGRRGVIVWDARVTDLFGTQYPGSGRVDVGADF